MKYKFTYPWLRSLGVMPQEVMDLGEEMFDDKVHKPINNKKRCGLFLGLLSLSLLLIVPIVSVTLYQFVTCFEMNHKLNLGKDYRVKDSDSEVSGIKHFRPENF